MGSKISIDKHVSSIEDILNMNPNNFSKIKFENKIPDYITQHLKVLNFLYNKFSNIFLYLKNLYKKLIFLKTFNKIWRFYETKTPNNKIMSSPISL